MNMKNTRFKQCKFFFLFFFLSIIPACDKPTYPREKLEESTIALCKNEYKIDVKVKIVGSTLGVFIPIEGLIDPDLKLNKDAGKKIENVALSIHRVTTSTDLPLKFYAMVARDTKMPGAEFVLTGFIYDVVRVRLFDISRDEYFKRILRDFRFNPIVTGEEKIKELFKGLNQNPASIESLKPIFYPTYTIGKKDSQKIEIVEMQSKEISDREALIYVKTSETYEIAPGFEAYLAIFPPGFINEYLFLVDLSMFPNSIKEIVPKYFYSNNEIKQRDLENTFEQYKDLGYIDSKGFPKKDMDLGWFLSRELSRRIKAMFEEDTKLNKMFKVDSVHGEIDNKIFRFKFAVTPLNEILQPFGLQDEPSRKNRKKNSPRAQLNELMVSKIIKLTGYVLHRYDFEDFEAVEFINTVDKENEKKIYLLKDDLERFRKGKLKIKDIN